MKTLQTLSLSMALGLGSVMASSPVLADHSAECGPPSTTIPGPPPELISVGQPMAEEWLRCYVWHDIEGQDYKPRELSEVQKLFFQGYPVECVNPVSEEGGTEGLIVVIIASGDEGRQTVRFTYRIQMDGDYINNCGQELIG